MSPITETEIEAVVTAFYARVRQEPLLGPIFNDAIDDWPVHLRKLEAFWSSVMLGSGRYKGQPIPAHVRHESRITPAAFQRWLALWRATTDEMLEPELAEALQEKAERIAQSLSLGLDFYRGRGLAMAQS